MVTKFSQANDFPRPNALIVSKNYQKRTTFALILLLTFEKGNTSQGNRIRSGAKTNRGFTLVYKIVPLKFPKKPALIQTNWRTTTRMSISLNVHRQNNLFQILWWLDPFAAEDNDAFPPPIWQSITSDHSV